MKRDQLETAVELSCAAAAAIWHQDVSALLELCREDVLWFDVGSNELKRGKKALAQGFFASLSPQYAGRLVEGRFEVAANNGSLCTVVGSYRTVAGDFSRLYQQRSSADWELEDGRLSVRFFHLSMPTALSGLSSEVQVFNTYGAIASEGERTDALPVGPATESHELHWALDALDCYPRYVCFPLAGKGTVMVPIDEIMWAGARGKHSYICTIVGGYEVNIGLSKVCEKLDDRFVTVHRSYVVNYAYILCASRDEIVMADAKTIAIPRKRMDEVAAALDLLRAREAEERADDQR